MNTEQRDAAAKVVQDVIKDRTCFGIGIGVIREALDTAFPITATPTNPAPVIETANGAVDMEPNTPHHTTRRIAELNDVVSALNESNNNLLHNQGIHEAAIAELQRKMDADIEWRNAEIARVHRGYQKLADSGQWDESLTELTGFTPADPPIPPQPTNDTDCPACKGVGGWGSWGGWEDCPDCGGSGKSSDSITVAHTQPTPPAAPDEDALWEQVVSAWERAMGNHPHPVDARGVRADVYAAKAAVAKAAQLGLVPTPKIEVTRDDVDAAWRVWQRKDTTMWEVLRDFASRKNGGA